MRDDQYLASRNAESILVDKWINRLAFRQFVTAVHCTSLFDTNVVQSVVIISCPCFCVTVHIK